MSSLDLGRHMNTSLSKVFQVGYADFCAIWRIDDPMDWEPPFVVREAGVFIPAPSPALIRQLTPAELGRVSHPTGSPGEPVLPFPCSLEEMMDWERDKVGEFGNEALVEWMRGRVEQHGHLMDGDTSLLFQINREDGLQLLPHADPSGPFPAFPCSIETLLEWCDDDAGERPWVDPPSNESIVRLIKGRVTMSGLGAESSAAALRTHERTSRENIILALGGDATIDRDSKSRNELNQEIAELCEARHIQLAKGKGGADSIARAVVAAAESGVITSASPRREAIRKILAEIREGQKAT